jgi:hypothetical protein
LKYEKESKTDVQYNAQQIGDLEKHIVQLHAKNKTYGRIGTVIIGVAKVVSGIAAEILYVPIAIIGTYFWAFDGGRMASPLKPFSELFGFIKDGGRDIADGFSTKKNFQDRIFRRIVNDRIQINHIVEEVKSKEKIANKQAEKIRNAVEEYKKQVILLNKTITTSAPSLNERNIIENFYKERDFSLEYEGKIKEMQRIIAAAGKNETIMGSKKTASSRRSYLSNAPIEKCEQALTAWIKQAGDKGGDRLEAAYRIRAAWQNKESTLDLSNLNLTEIPDTFEYMQHLQKLDVSNNPELSRLPQFIKYTKITQLPHASTKISDSDETLKSLSMNPSERYR